MYAYNRENFMFDKEQVQKREFQSQKLRIKQFTLYREDIRDMMELTCGKMDCYLIVNTLQLMFVIILFTEGRPFLEGPEELSPTWLMFLYGLNGAGAFTFLILSIWLSIHASVAAHSFGVRMLTQFVRLPVPNRKQLDLTGRFSGKDYEASGAETMFRIPLWRQQMQRFNSAMGDLTMKDSELKRLSVEMDEAGAEDSSTPVGLLKHVRLYRQLQANWQAYDAYARVSMSLGTNQLILHTAYYVLELMAFEKHGLEVAFAIVIVMGTAAWLVARLDMYVSRASLSCILAVNTLAPLLTAICLLFVKLESLQESKVTAERVLIPIVFFLHMVWILMVVRFAMPEQYEEISLPVKFRSVLYLDVFGWLDKNATSRPGARPTLRRGQTGFDQAPSTAPEGEAPLTAVQEDNGDDMVARVMSNGAIGSVSTLVRASAPRSGSSAVDMARPQSFTSQQARSMHRSPLVALGRECRRTRRELDRELSCWEQPSVKTLLDDDPARTVALAAIEKLRKTFDEVCETFEQVDPEPGQIPQEEDAKVTIWLSLQCQVHADVLQYFYNVETSENSWDPPAASEFVSDFRGIEVRIDDFSQVVRELQRSAEAGATSMIQPSAVPTDQPGGAATSDASHAAPARGLSNTSVASSRDAAPEAPFGGQEATQVQQGTPYQQTYFAAHAAAGASFHPDRAAAGTQRSTRRLPGQMPWRVFSQASLVLVGAWAVGLFFAFCEIVGKVHIPGMDKRNPSHDNEPVEPHEQAVLWPSLLESSWPHQYFNPVGVACHDALGARVFVAERYGVYELTSDGMLVPALENCLARSPEIQFAGLDAISVTCDIRQCWSLLWSRDGTSFLNCSLENSSQVVVGKTHGDWLYRFATDDGLWALESDAFVQLEMLEGKTSEFVPTALFPKVQATPVRQIHGGHGQDLLVMDEAGVLAVERGGRERRVMRLTKNIKWVSMCRTDSQFYLVSASSPERPAGLWRTELDFF